MKDSVTRTEGKCKWTQIHADYPHSSVSICGVSLSAMLL